MLVSRNAVKVGTVMASGEQVVKLVRMQGKIIAVLSKNGKQRTAEWKSSGKLFVKKP
jgi:hypothetical protein